MNNLFKFTLVLIAAVVLTACSSAGTGGASKRGVVKRTADEDALLSAARGGNADTVKALLMVQGININVPDDAGNTPLILAARFGHDDTVKQLLIGGADVKIKNNNGTSALNLAARGGHTQTVELLRQAGATE